MRIGTSRSASATGLIQAGTRPPRTANSSVTRQPQVRVSAPAAIAAVPHRLGVAALGGGLGRAHRDQALAERSRAGIVRQDLRARARARDRRLGALERAGDARHQADVHDGLVVRAEELEGAPEIAGRRLRGLGMHGTRREHAGRIPRRTARPCRGSSACRNARAPAPRACRAPRAPTPGRSAAESVTTATRRRAAWCAISCCRRMSSAFSPPTAPKPAARANTRGGSLVWTCSRTLLRVPATTRLEPSRDACSRRRRWSIASPVIVHSVHQRCSRSTCEPAVASSSESSWIAASSAGATPVSR